MKDEEFPQLKKAIKEAGYTHYLPALSGMKYCAVANFGKINAGISERVQFYVNNPNVNNTTNLVRYIHSGLQEESFAYTISNLLKGYLEEGSIKALKYEGNGCFSFMANEEIVANLISLFPVNRFTFAAFNTEIELLSALDTAKNIQKDRTVMAPSMYLDA